MSTVHQKPLELAAAAVDFELSTQERDELDRHLASCSPCRSRVEALRRDALGIEALPILPVAAEQAARLRAATLRRPGRPAWSALRLVAVAAMIALLALAAVAVGSSLVDREPINLSVVDPGPSVVVPATGPPSPAPSVAPSNPPPSASPEEEPAGYRPPAPICPAPTQAVPAPEIRMDSADGEIVLRPVMAEQLVMTCSTTAPSDGAGAEPEEGEVVYLGDVIALSVDPAWRIVHWEGSDRPRAGDEINVITGETLAGGRSSVMVPVPEREGDVILGLTVWTQSTDGRVVASTSLSTWLKIEPPPGGFPLAVPGELTQADVNVGCDSVGWPEEIPEYRSLTFGMDAADRGYVTARSDTGASIEVQWAGEGFQIDADTILDAEGEVILQDGDTIDLPSDGSLPRLGRYAVCLSPEDLIVFVAD